MMEFLSYISTFDFGSFGLKTIVGIFLFFLALSFFMAVLEVTKTFIVSYLKSAFSKWGKRNGVLAIVILLLIMPFCFLLVLEVESKQNSKDQFVEHSTLSPQAGELDKECIRVLRTSQDMHVVETSPTCGTYRQQLPEGLIHNAGQFATFVESDEITCAINASFRITSSKIIIGNQISRGQIIYIDKKFPHSEEFYLPSNMRNSELPIGTTVGFKRTGQVVLGRVVVTERLVVGGKEIPITHINPKNENLSDAKVKYTPEYTRVRSELGVSSNSTTMIVKNNVFVELSWSNKVTIPNDGYVVVFSGVWKDVPSVLEEGSFVTLERTFKDIETGRDVSGDWFDVIEAVGGAVRLLTAGEVTVQAKKEGFRNNDLINPTKDPRTRSGFGIIGNGNVLFVVAKSITVMELARELKNLGAKDAVLFDGGSSSQLVCKGKSFSNESTSSNAIVFTEVDKDFGRDMTDVLKNLLDEIHQTKCHGGGIERRFFTKKGILQQRTEFNDNDFSGCRKFWQSQRSFTVEKVKVIYLSETQVEVDAVIEYIDIYGKKDVSKPLYSLVYAPSISGESKWLIDHQCFETVCPTFEELRP